MLTLFAAPSAALGSVQSLGLHAGRARRLGYDPRVPRALRRAIAGLAPAAVVAHGSEALKYLTRANVSAPLVYHRTGIASDAARRGWRRRLQRRIAASATLIIAVSEDARDDVMRFLDGSGPPVVVVRNARDPDVYTPAPNRDASLPPAVLFIAHLTPAKRPDLFLETVRRLRDSGLDVRARIVGDGPLLEHIRSSAPPDVEVLGRRDDVPDLLRDADLLLFTGLPQGEGLPGVLVEAAMAGIPVVTTSVPGTDHAVVNGTTGYVVAVSDFEGIVEATARLVREPARRAEMGAAARRHAVEHFGLDTMLARWRQELDAVIVRDLEQKRA